MSLSTTVSCTGQIGIDRKELEAAEAAGVSGHDTTPFLLDFIHRETSGRSLDVNMEVYRGNVELGARIALALSEPAPSETA